MKKRLLTLRNNWAVITEGKITNVSTGVDEDIEVRIQVQGGFVKSVFTQVVFLPGITVFFPFPQSVMFNMNTSFKTYLKQYFSCKAFPAASSLIYVIFLFFLLFFSNQPIPLSQCLSLYGVCWFPHTFPSPPYFGDFNQMCYLVNAQWILDEWMNEWMDEGILLFPESWQ